MTVKTIEQQMTFGVVWGFKPFMPVARHESDCRVCADCEEQTALRDWNGELGKCKDCESNDHAVCEGCDDWHDADEFRENNRGEELCEDCSCDTNFVCEGCDDLTHRYDCMTTDDGTVYCDCCYRQEYTTCSDCDAETRIHDCDDNNRCPDCSCGDEDSTWDAEVDRIESDDYDRIGSRRTFGVEMETDSCDGHYDWARNHGWACCEDGSINGKEFVSPVLSGNAGYDSAKEFIDRMGRMGCTVNDDCGFHLHIGVSDVSDDGIKSIALAYHYARNVFEGWVDESRRDTYYARRNCDSKHGHSDQWDYDSIMSCDDRPDQSTRYVWINWKAYDRFKTYEVRSHEPTCDGNAVCNWIKLHTEFADIFGKMSPRQVVRKFRHLSDKQIVRELRVMMNETVIDYYTAKSLQSS